MPSALLTVWPLYIVGSAIVFLGFLAFHSWIRGITGRGPDQPGSILGASVVAFVLGFATIAITIGLDQAQTVSSNTRTLVVPCRGPHPRHASGCNCAAPARGAGVLQLPELDPSGLRLNRTQNDLNVLLIATANVTFDIRAQVQTSAFNQTLTHVTLSSGSPVQNANATVRMAADGSNTTTVDLSLEIQLLEPCGFRAFVLVTTLREGTAVYPGTLTTGTC